MTAHAVESSSTKHKIMTSWIHRLSLSWLCLSLSVYNSRVQAAADVEHKDATITKLAFGSCHKRKYIGQTLIIWKAIRETQPDAFLWTGDTVYPSKRGVASVQDLQEEYQHMSFNKSLGYTDFNPPFGIYGTWDDHDYGGNDWGIEMPDKEKRRDAYMKFVLSKNKEVSNFYENRQGVYGSVEWGEAPRKVKAILLDTRWHREPHCIPSFATIIPLGAALSCITRWITAGLNLPKNVPALCRTHKNPSLLGEEQWLWLENEIKTSDAQVHVVVSSVQVLTTNPALESWGFFQQERDRFLELLNGVPGLILLSGDVHFAEFLDPTASIQGNETKQSFLEVTSSGLTHTCTTPFYGVLCRPLLEAFGTNRYHTEDQQENPFFFIKRNFGTLEIDWEANTLEANIHNADGQVVMSTGPRSLRTDMLTKDELKHVAPCMDGHLIPLFVRCCMAIVTCVILAVWLLLRKRLQTASQKKKNV